jgi:hypothetical protein
MISHWPKWRSCTSSRHREIGVLLPGGMHGAEKAAHEGECHALIVAVNESAAAASVRADAFLQSCFIGASPAPTTTHGRRTERSAAPVITARPTHGSRPRSTTGLNHLNEAIRRVVRSTSTRTTTTAIAGGRRLPVRVDQGFNGARTCRTRHMARRSPSASR